MKDLLLTFGLAVSLTTLISCKAEKAPKAPAKKDSSLDQEEQEGLEGGDDDGEFVPEDTSTDTDTETETVAPLSIEVSDANALKAKIGAPVSVAFDLKGAEGKAVAVGLMELPEGATLEKSGDKVTFKWASPLGGSHAIKFLLRDKDKCEEAGGDCDIATSDFGKLTAKQYDVQSETFTLEVETEDNLPQPGQNGGLGGLGGLGGNNDQLIQQIIQLLGGNGPGIQGLLQGLSGGQLNQILNQLQIGGGGGGIGQLIGLIGNL